MTPTKTHARMKAIGGTFLCLLMVCVCVAQPIQRQPTEIEIVREISARLTGSETEYRLHNGTRVDLMCGEWAIESDYPAKWAECYGQAKYYSVITGRKPVMLFLVSDLQAESKYLDRAFVLSAAGGVEVWCYDLKSRDWLNVGRPPILNRKGG